MALLHFCLTHAAQYKITLSALNCDHAIRGEESERDSAFVKAYCGANGIKLYFFKAEKGAFADENSARDWRLKCYKEVLSEREADFIATAHHLSDNAETVLFNLARGASLSGLRGIGDEPSLGLIRPLIGCTREEIDGYVEENAIPYVTDSTNLTCGYTRNKIRLNVLPRLEEAVPGAAKAIYRFSRLAREDEEYFSAKASKITFCRSQNNYLLKPCAERVIFRRAAAAVIADKFLRRDYTSEHLESIFLLQNAQNGKKFAFLGLEAVKEEGGVAICETAAVMSEILFCDWLGGVKSPVFAFGRPEIERHGRDCLEKAREKSAAGRKVLCFDCDKIPATAVVRTRREGDKFGKFGGGNISLSDYFTDKKIPQSLRGYLPLICDNSEVLAICGVEISEKIKIDKDSENCAAVYCADPMRTG